MRSPVAVLAAAGAIAFVALSAVVASGATTPIDATVTAYLRAHATPAATWLFWGISDCGSGAARWVIAILCGMALILLPPLRYRALTLLIAIGGAELWIDALKILLHRPRPDPALDLRLGYSFPSGHALLAVTVYGLIAVWLARGGPPWRRALVAAAFPALILLIGFSRIYLGQHYLTDVLGGYAAGLVWLSACIRLSEWLEAHQHRAVEQNGRPGT